MHGYFNGHRIERQGRARVFWWTVDGRSERFASLPAATAWLKARRPSAPSTPTLGRDLRLVSAGA